MARGQMRLVVDQRQGGPWPLKKGGRWDEDTAETVRGIHDSAASKKKDPGPEISPHEEPGVSGSGKSEERTE